MSNDRKNAERIAAVRAAELVRGRGDPIVTAIAYAIRVLDQELTLAETRNDRKPRLCGSARADGSR